jgi:thiamine pyrophosphokinase
VYNRGTTVRLSEGTRNYFFSTAIRPIRGVKWPVRDAGHSYLVPRSIMSGSVPICFHGMHKDMFMCFTNNQ